MRKPHHKYSSFLKNAGSELNLYIGIHVMPNKNTEEREAVETQLLEKYNPECQDLFLYPFFYYNRVREYCQFYGHAIISRSSCTIEYIRIRARLSEVKRYFHNYI